MDTYDIIRGTELPRQNRSLSIAAQNVLDRPVKPEKEPPRIKEQEKPNFAHFIPSSIEIL